MSLGSPADATRSLRAYLLEETYEALDAIDRGDLDALRGELGDVLLKWSSMPDRRRAPADSTSSTSSRR